MAAVKLLMLMIGICSAKSVKRHGCTELGGECFRSPYKCDGDVYGGKKYCKGKMDICCVPTGCWFDNERYLNGSFRIQECLELQCVIGIWTVYEILSECGHCTFGGDPLIYPFDELVDNTGPGVPTTTNVISVNETCDFVMTQSGFVIPNAPGWPYNIDPESPPGRSDFGVNANFIDYWTGRPNVAMNGITYYEPWISIKIHLVPGYGKLVLPPSIEVTTYPGGGNTLRLLPGAINCYPIPKPDSHLVNWMIWVIRTTNCIIIFGNRGLTVVMCEQLSPLSMPWAYIYAAPYLMSAPTHSSLYGLCNTWTGGPQNFWDHPMPNQIQPGVPTSNPGWNCGSSNLYGLPSLCDDDALTWKAPPS